jgi:competence protein ComEC
MRFFSLLFLSGILFFTNLSTIPTHTQVAILILTLIICLYFKFTRFITVIICGFLWALCCANHKLSWKLPDQIEGRTIQIQGNIQTIPNIFYQTASFLFYVKKLQYDDQIQPVNAQVKVTWRSKNLPVLHVGDAWKLTVHLKKIHSTANPGGFDYEAHAFEEGIRAAGYIVDKEKNQLLISHWYYRPIDRVREMLKNKIEANIVKSNTSSWITALIVGERNNIPQTEWDVLRNTGTNHLMAIAGLHIGIMAGFAYTLISMFWRRISILTLYFPAQYAGSIAALLMALLYSSLAGFSLPAQRACIMLITFLFFTLLKRNLLSWHAWATALILVLLIDPFSVLTESFWLSFGAVALIIYGVSGRLAPSGLWWKLGRIQWVIALGLVPLSFWLFQQCSLISFIANSIAIPWVGFLVVPMSLLGAATLLFSAKDGGFILSAADKVLNILWIILTKLAHLSWASWYQYIPHTWIIVIACLGIILLLVPVGVPGRYFGLFWLLPLFLYPAKDLKSGEAIFTLLDVGQGLSTVVQTQHHILVFDTGAKFNTNFDMGESVVVPYLRSEGVKKIDMLMISHGDNDHIGGAEAVLKAFPTQVIKTSVPEEFLNQHASYCLRGEKWDWDGVNFEIIYPTTDFLGLDNDSSCVLRISVGPHQILLTGDIEKFAEKNLTEFELPQLKSEILVAPHHGSKTSAEDAFVTAVQPHYVLFPVGYRNRYHFPHQIVVDKYKKLAAIELDTVNSGAVQFEINEKLSLQFPTEYRKAHLHFWEI